MFGGHRSCCPSCPSPTLCPGCHISPQLSQGLSAVEVPLEREFLLPRSNMCHVPAIHLGLGCSTAAACLQAELEITAERRDALARESSSPVTCHSTAQSHWDIRKGHWASATALSLPKAADTGTLPPQRGGQGLWKLCLPSPPLGSLSPESL